METKVIQGDAAFIATSLVVLALDGWVLKDIQLIDKTAFKAYLERGTRP